MPPHPAGKDNGKKTKDDIDRKFSEAAAALTALYRESTDAYEMGYRDALLYVHRYVLLTTAASREGGSTAPSSTASSASPPLHAAVRAEQLLNFLQNSLSRRRLRVAYARGLTERRRSREAMDDEGVAEANGITPSVSSLSVSAGHVDGSASRGSSGEMLAEESAPLRIEDVVISRPTGTEGRPDCEVSVFCNGIGQNTNRPPAERDEPPFSYPCYETRHRDM